jgi:coproporphyrinogen III oxidase-like Fe-S oxidoreductase
VVASVERALSLEPDRIASFGYAYAPWMKRHQKLLPDPAMAGPLERLRQMRAAAAAIVAAGRVPTASTISQFRKIRSTSASGGGACGEISRAIPTTGRRRR